MAIASGLCAGVIVADLGRPFTIVASIYLLACASAAVGAALRRAPGEKWLRRLLWGPWALTALFVVLAVMTLAQGRSPVQGFAWAGVTALFAWSTRAAVTRLAGSTA